MKNMKSWDIKLTDGRYFSNVIICDEYGEEDIVEIILDNQYIDDGQVINLEMSIFKADDEDGKNELTKCYSKDIEYICKSYEYNCLQ